MDINLTVVVVDENSAYSDLLKKKDIAHVSIRGEMKLVERISKLIMDNFPRVE